MINLRSLLCFLGLAFLLVSPPPACGAVHTDDYYQVLRQVHIISQSPYVKELPPGKSGTSRQIPGLVISDFSMNSEDKARIFLCAGQHGDEYNAVESLLEFAALLADGSERRILRNCLVIVVPMINPDGIATGHRLNGQDIDINRDWLDLRTREARYVDGIIKKWQPQVLIDAHEWTDISPVPGNEIEVAQCVSELQSNAMQRAASSAASSARLAIIDCTPEANKQLFHRRYAMCGYGAFLIETAWGESYASKDNTYKSAIHAMINAVIDDEELKYSISSSTREFSAARLTGYLDHLTDSTQSGSAASSVMFTALLLGGWVLIMWIVKSRSSEEDSQWSHRFRKCAVDSEVVNHPLIKRRRLIPITAKSSVHRRMLARYSVPRSKAAVPDRSKHIPQWPLEPVVSYGWSQMDEQQMPNQYCRKYWF